MRHAVLQLARLEQLSHGRETTAAYASRRPVRIQGQWTADAVLNYDEWLGSLTSRAGVAIATLTVAMKKTVAAALKSRPRGRWPGGPRAGTCRHSRIDLDSIWCTTRSRTRSDGNRSRRSDLGAPREATVASPSPMKTRCNILSFRGAPCSLYR